MTTKKTELDIAREVMAGKWGIGKDRENAIWNAGYDYNLVQAFVNEMVTTGKDIREITVNAKDVSGLIVHVEK